MANDLAPPGPCRLLEWDSAFFGFRIARLLPDRLNEQTATEVFPWCRSERVRCLYFLAAPDCAETTWTAERHGFRLTDIRIAFDRKLTADCGMVDSVRGYREADLPALRAIAAASHHDSRFYYDPVFPAERCDALYSSWIDRSCHGYADAVFVAEHKSEPAGYISCHLNGESVGSIGLVAIAEHARGHGLGPQLVTAAIRYFGRMGCDRVTVVTQGRNLPAQRLYQNCGFRTAVVGIWYHRWFEL